MESVTLFTLGNLHALMSDDDREKAPEKSASSAASENRRFRREKWPMGPPPWTEKLEATLRDEAHQYKAPLEYVSIPGFKRKMEDAEDAGDAGEDCQGEGEEDCQGEGEEDKDDLWEDEEEEDCDQDWWQEVSWLDSVGFQFLCMEIVTVIVITTSLLMATLGEGTWNDCFAEDYFSFSSSEIHFLGNLYREYIILEN